MNRRSLDRLISATGLLMAAVLLSAGALCTWASVFVADQVRTQLSAQQIFFPAEGSPATSAAEFAPMRQYAGQQLTTGAQAEVYADDFIANHLKAIGGGKTYAQLSSQAQADPTNTKLAGTVETMFKGETLRGLLLNAYAFGTMGSIAAVAAIAAFVGAAVMLLLSALGIRHARHQNSVASTRAVTPAVTGPRGEGAPSSPPPAPVAAGRPA